MKKIVFIAWTRYQRRSDVIAQRLGATMKHIYFGRPGNVFHAPLRYLVQAWQTWKFLKQENPDVIFIQSPPVFCVMLVYFYSQRSGAKYIIDAHTGAFLSWKWRWSLGLQRLLSRRALLTLIHNASQEKIVKYWNCRYSIFPDLLNDGLVGESIRLNGNFSVVVVGSFAEDEPTEVVFKAARKLDGVQFYFTGDPDHLNPRLRANKPDNCQLTGYLPEKKYVGYLQNSDCVMVLTKRNHTLLSGAYEAVSLAKPLIISDWPVLRSFFHLGTVHVPNTVEGIVNGVTSVQLNQVTLQNEVETLRDELHALSRSNLAKLEEMMRESNEI